MTEKQVHTPSHTRAAGLNPACTPKNCSTGAVDFAAAAVVVVIPILDMRVDMRIEKWVDRGVDMQVDMRIDMRMTCRSTCG